MLVPEASGGMTQTRTGPISCPVAKDSPCVPSQQADLAGPALVSALCALSSRPKELSAVVASDVFATAHWCLHRNDTNLR